MNTKICCKCHKDLPLTPEFFASNKTREDGFQVQCRTCQRIYRIEHYQRNRQKYIDKARKNSDTFVLWFKEFKSTLKCNRCPENHPACLCFHHINPNEKEHTVSHLVNSGSKQKLLDEIAKCEVLCQNCHSKEHWAEGFEKITA